MNELFVPWGRGYSPWDMGTGDDVGLGRLDWYDFYDYFLDLVIAGAIYLIKWLVGNFQKKPRLFSGDQSRPGNSERALCPRGNFSGRIQQGQTRSPGLTEIL